VKKFKIQKSGEFSSDILNEEIKLALQKIKNEKYLPVFGQKIIKNVIEPALHLGGNLYSGNYMIFQIENYCEAVGNLHCFLSSDNTFINIIVV